MSGSEGTEEMARMEGMYEGYDDIEEFERQAATGTLLNDGAALQEVM